MKIFLNDRKIKETNHFVMCDKCVLMRETNTKLLIRCLARTFNLCKKGHFCSRGYQYEDKV